MSTSFGFALQARKRFPGSSVRSLVLDNHGSHELIKKALLGQFAAKSEVPFFGQLQYQPLPSTWPASFM